MSYTKGKRANVAKVCNVLGLTPRFIDLTVGGYRVHYLRSATQEEVNEARAVVQKELNLDVFFRRRKGHGPYSGEFDMIIPFADANHERVFYTY